MKNKLHDSVIFFSLIFAILILASPTDTYAQSAEEIKDKIEDRGTKIQQLEKEIQEHEKELEIVGKEKQTLTNTLYTLDLSRKKISTDINLTQHKIGVTDVEINEIDAEIALKEARVNTNKQAIAETLRIINEVESDSLVETILAHNNLSEVWDRVETLERFQLVIRGDVVKLNELKRELEEKKSESQTKRTDLTRYKQDLSGKKQVLDSNRNEKNQLLKITKNKESNYQNLISQKRAAQEQFEREMQEFEAQLKYTLDPSLIPTAGQGVLGWPLDTLRVTQYFGNTPFAKSGAYSGKGHNGMDFGISQGTRVKAALGGVVLGAGNTDLVRGCYSYGKWVLLGHNNGLATLYAHLSVISVSKGQTLSTGDVIGFSGNTGYSTGPHLHFSVYFSDAVQIIRLGDIKKITSCAAVSIPVAPLEAYLNPLDYLRDAESLR